MDLLSPVSELMSQDLISVHPEDHLSVVQKIFESYKIHHVPVVEGDKLVGLISKNDFYHLLTSDNQKTVAEILAEAPVKSIMTKGLARLEPTDRIDVALELFKINRFHAVPVTLEDHTLVGMLTTHDIIKALAEGRLKTKE